MKRIHKILIANRGEVALRIMRTCRDMGIATACIYSDADADAPFVRAADEAVRVGPAPSAESYLRIDAVIEAAARVAADAVHPGYGFLAENAAFARACANAKLVFIGPSAEVISTLGSKRAAKKLVAAAGVAVIPGCEVDGDVDAIGFPLLVKASAGGGGRGMRVVRKADALPGAVESARREAASAFGDDTLLLERYIESPRHVEIQILGDEHGNVIHLLERECSVQRRHQKIIEETPSVAVDDNLRQRMGAAAVTVARAAHYTGAGTVEFILAPDGSFYFLEVNTRLQVEHPVTECVTGIDIVREQIRIARGEALGLEQSEVMQRGAAIECRLYAEDPDNDFLPTSGRIVHWQCAAGDGIRVDTGVESGQDVSIFYDPMLAKLVAHAPTRAEAIARMIDALHRTSVLGVVTNRDYLIRVLEHEAFARGDIDTHFVYSHADSLGRTALTQDRIRVAMIAATLFDHEERRRSRQVLPALESGYRNSRFREQVVAFALSDSAGDDDDDVIELRYVNKGGGRFSCGVDGEGKDWSVEVTLGAVRDGRFGLTVDGHRQNVHVVRDGTRRFVHAPQWQAQLHVRPRFPEAKTAVAPGACIAPMPAKVLTVLVEPGQSVSAGEDLVVLEAMKMEHTLRASTAGLVAMVSAVAGDQVAADAVLVVVEPAE